jgi:hypothetical protein
MGCSSTMPNRRSGRLWGSFSRDTSEIMMSHTPCSIPSPNYVEYDNKHKWDGFAVDGDKYNSFGIFIDWAKKDNSALCKQINEEIKTLKRDEKTSLKEAKKHTRTQEDRDSVVGILDRDDDMCADVILENYPHWKYCNQQLYVSGMWSTSKAIQNNLIGSLSDKLNIIKMTPEGAKYTGKNYGNNHGKRKDVYEFIHQKTVDGDWILRSQYTSLGKILFTNGYYNFKKSVFESSKINDFDPNIVIHCRIDHDFNHFDGADEEYIETVKHRLFGLPLGEEVEDYLILYLARSLAGDMMKRVMFGLRMSNTGKGIMTKALQLSLGQYVDTFNAENLAYSASSTDEAAKLRWAMLLQAKRIIISNEITNDKPLNGNIIKKICSGGDSLKGRGHGGNETSFVPQFNVICLANDNPEIKPYDDALMNRVRVYVYYS